jgi:hypothetical protein
MKNQKEIEKNIFDYRDYINLMKKDMDYFIRELTKEGHAIDMNSDYILGRQKRIFRLESKIEALEWVLSDM